MEKDRFMDSSRFAGERSSPCVSWDEGSAIFPGVVMTWMGSVMRLGHQQKETLLWRHKNTGAS